MKVNVKVSNTYDFIFISYDVLFLYLGPGPGSGPQSGAGPGTAGYSHVFHSYHMLGVDIQHFESLNISTYEI